MSICLFFAWRGHCDSYLRQIFEYSLTSEHFKTNIGHLQTSNGLITIDKLSFAQTDNTKFFANNIKIEFNLNNLSKLVLGAEIHIKKLELLSNSSQEIIVADAVIHNKIELIRLKSSMVIQLNNIQSNFLETQEAKSICYITKTFNRTKIFDCRFAPSNKSNIEVDSVISNDNLDVKIVVNNIPIVFYNFAKQIYPNNDLISFLEDHIPKGDIVAGVLNVHMDQDAKSHTENKAHTSETLNGKFSLENVDFHYNENFPPVTKAVFDVIIDGSSVIIPIKQAYSGQSLLYDGIVKWNFENEEEAISISAIAKGPVLDLISFVSAKELETIKSKDIDLKTITGKAKSIIKLAIFTNPETPNSYDVASDIMEANIEIFKDKIKIKDGNLKALFDGEKLVVTGKCKINNFDSILKFQENLANNSNFSTLLQITVSIIANNHKIDAIKLVSGKAVAEIEYKNTQKLHNVALKSNLKNLEFIIDHISIHKPVGEKANLDVTMDLLNNNSVKFNLVGDDNLKIIGTLNATEEAYKLVVSTLRYHNTDVKANISSTATNFQASISGSQLDLSSGDMTDFIKKHHLNISTNIDANISHVLLKNKVDLKDLQFQLQCDKTKCIKGNLDAKITNGFIKMVVWPSVEKEEWRITSNNLSSILRGLDITNKVKAGSVELILNTSRNQGKIGEVIPILDGSFSCTKMVVSKMPFLTSIVSAISFPGFLNLITRNDTIRFSSINGKLSYQNNILAFTDSVGEGSFFDFTAKGAIDQNTHKIVVKGRVIPAIYGINSLVKQIPIISTIFGGGHRKGLFSAPFFYNTSY